jgi:hypothetical protein
MLYNIDPNRWGKHLWRFGHYLTLAYPDNPTDEDKQNIKDFFTLLQKVLPCEKCRLNYSKHLIQTPLSDDILNNRDMLIVWFFTLHNKVNALNNKPLMTKQEFIDDYINNKKESSQKHILLILLIVIIIVGIFLYKKFIN